MCFTWLKLYEEQAHRRGDPPVEAGTSAVNKSSKTVAKLFLLFPLPPTLSHPPRLSLVARQKLLLKVVTGASIGGNLQLRSEGCLHLISGELAKTSPKTQRTQPNICDTPHQLNVWQAKHAVPLHRLPPASHATLETSTAAIVARLVAVFDKFSLSAFWTWQIHLIACRTLLPKTFPQMRFFYAFFEYLYYSPSPLSLFWHVWNRRFYNCDNNDSIWGPA